jgi:hypothetical protein
MAKDWLQTERLARMAQNQRFCTGVLRHEAVLNLSRAETATVIRDLQWSTYYLNYAMWLERELEGAEIRARVKHDSGYRADPVSDNILPSPPSGFFEGDPSIPLTPEPAPGIDFRFRALVRTIKASSNYHPSIGAELDVLVPPGGSHGNTLAQPKLKVQALTGGAIQLTVRPMKFQSVLFQCRVAGAESFLTIAKSTTGKLTWHAPGPFPRALEVRARFEDQDQPVGIPCPILPVTASA